MVLQWFAGTLSGHGGRGILHPLLLISVWLVNRFIFLVTLSRHCSFKNRDVNQFYGKLSGIQSGRLPTLVPEWVCCFRPTTSPLFPAGWWTAVTQLSNPRCCSLLLSLSVSPLLSPFSILVWSHFKLCVITFCTSTQHFLSQMSCKISAGSICSYHHQWIMK